MSLPLRTNTLLFAAVAVIAIGLGLYAQSSKQSSVAAGNFESLILLPQAKNVQNVAFIDHNGQPFTQDNLIGRWTLMFFGFTNCPDICPTTLQTLGQLKKNLSAESKWPDIQVVMVSVDPERDTQEKLSKYVPWFDDSFLGLRAEVSDTETFAKQVGVLFYKRELESGTTYEVDHSSSLILFNPEGQYAGVLTAPHTVDLIAADLSELARSQEIPLIGQAAQKQEQATNEGAQEINPSNLQVSNAWVRLGPPSAHALAGYMTLSNKSDSPITLVAAQSDAFGMTMMHNTVIEDGVASMNHLDKVVVPANGELQFKPMGMHLMLMRPNESFNEGDTIDIQLSDDSGNEYQQSFTVKKG